MGINCAECKQFIGGGHARSCSRYRASFQVPVTYEASGYLNVQAKDAIDAERIVRSLSVTIDYGGCDSDLMPDFPDLRITGEVEEVEEV